MLGKEVWVTAEDVGPDGRRLNSLPPGFKTGYKLKAFTDRHARCHLQLVSQKLDEVLTLMDTCLNIPPCERPLQGINRVDTPCTCHAGLARALETRQRLSNPDRPWRIADRHARGYQKELKQFYTTIKKIIQQSGATRPDPLKRYEKYSGTKRVHYQKCAAEFEAYPLGTPAGHEIFHEGAVKWGELSARPRALLVQSVRAKGTKRTRSGEILRVPIMVEGGYRDQIEDALHRYCHRRGFHYCASGMSLHKRAKKMKQMIEPGDIVLSCDWSSFDGSLGWLGVWERLQFLAIMEELYGPDPALREVILTQNDCKVQAKALYGRIFGNRGSGTAGTSSGNKMVVIAAILYALGPAMRGRNGCKLFCDGDDTLIIVPKEWQGERWVSSWCRRFTELGLETKVEQIIVDSPAVQAVDEVRFCRAGVIDTPRGPFLCKSPSDAIRVVTNLRRHFRGPQIRDYATTLAIGLRDTYGDVPVLKELWKWFDVGGHYNRLLYESSGLEYMLQKTTCRWQGTEPDHNHRMSFYRTFGMPPTVQIHCEQLLAYLAPHARSAIMAGCQ